MVLDDEIGRVFVRAGGGAVALDAESLAPVGGSLASATLGPFGGRSLAVDRRRRQLVVPLADDRLACFDATADDWAAQVAPGEPIATGRVPFVMIADEARDRVVVSCMGDRVVQAVDLAARTVVASSEVGRGARGLALARDGGTLFVTCFEDSVVQLLDAQTLALTATVPTPSGPRGCLPVRA
jgi:DNA-binding beta-propeller fold protein YncE